MKETRFKVGDKVKVVNAGELYATYKDFIKENAPQLLNKWEHGRYLPDGGSYEVKAIGKHIFDRELAIIEQNNKVYIVNFKGLELVKQFTKSDLKDNHIVVLENGNKSVWGNVNQDKFNEDLSHEGIDKYSIKEVYEFDKLVWKREILDEVEKEYLSDVIRPFRDRVINIIKIDNRIGIFIAIRIKDEESIDLPYLKNKNMYKGMEINKEYTLKELGLE